MIRRRGNVGNGKTGGRAADERPPDQCSGGGGSGYDARRSRRGASRRDAEERESAARKAQSTSGVFARNPDTRCALPGDNRVRRDARRPLRRAGILAGVRNTHVRPLNFARLSRPDVRERETERRQRRGVCPVGEN